MNSTVQSASTPYFELGIKLGIKLEIHENIYCDLCHSYDYYCMSPTAVRQKQHNATMSEGEYIPMNWIIV